MKKDSGKRTNGVVPLAACFRQRVEIAAAQAEGLPDEDLAAALAFELEPFSGIPFSEGRLAWKRLESDQGGRVAFDTVEIRSSELEGALASLGAGARFVTAIPAEGEPIESLPAIPVSPRRSARAFGPMKIWFAVSLVAALALVALSFVRTLRVRTLERLVSERSVLEAERARLASRAASLADEAASIRRGRADFARAQDDAAALRSAWQALLVAIPKACGGESVLVSVEPGDEGFVAAVRGSSLSPAAAARVSTLLAEELRTPKSAWVLRPGRIGAVSPGGTVPFECALEFDPNRSFQ